MCGFAGVLNLDGKRALREALKRMTGAIAHHGLVGAGGPQVADLVAAKLRTAVQDLSWRGCILVRHR